ncbi:MAG: hypothetical protein R2881_07690 [Eubacteriales bacterium]
MTRRLLCSRFEAEDARGFAKPVSYETKTDTLVLHFDRHAGKRRGAARQLAQQPRSGGTVGLYALPDAGFYGLPITNE